MNNELSFVNGEWIRFFNDENEQINNNNKSIIGNIKDDDNGKLKYCYNNVLICEHILKNFDPKKQGCRHLLLQKKNSIVVIRSAKRISFGCHACIFGKKEENELIHMAHEKLERTKEIMDEPLHSTDFKYAFWTVEAKVTSKHSLFSEEEGCVKCKEKSKYISSLSPEGKILKQILFYNVLVLTNTKIYNQQKIFHMFIEEICSIKCLNKIQRHYKNMDKILRNVFLYYSFLSFRQTFY